MSDVRIYEVISRARHPGSCQRDAKLRNKRAPFRMVETTEMSHQQLNKGKKLSTKQNRIVAPAHVSPPFYDPLHMVTSQPTLRSSPSTYLPHLFRAFPSLWPT